MAGLDTEAGPATEGGRALGFCGDEGSVDWAKEEDKGGDFCGAAG